jgi:hypothetical protein
MEIQALKIFNSIKLILFLNLILGVITVLTACGDLVKESDANACNSAIDARNYETAKSVCTSRKDKASAYMGLAGYDIVNLIKSSGTSTSTLTDPTTGSTLGKDDNVGASILNILQLSVADIADKNTRAAAISSSRTNLDSASALLQPSLGDNSSSPLTTDEILLNTFAISFAMQLNQLEIFDNKTTSTSTLPSVNNLSCTQVSDYASTKARVVLIAMDGHLWAAERNGMMCNRIKNAVDALADNTTVVSASFKQGDKLHPHIYDTVCGPLNSMTEYLADLALNLTELKKAISLSGDNTKVIEKADNSTNELLKAVGCKE